MCLFDVFGVPSTDPLITSEMTGSSTKQTPLISDNIYNYQSITEKKNFIHNQQESVKRTN